MTSREFKVGDKVRAFGVEGVVSEISQHPIFPVLVQFYPQEANPCESFTLDGRSFNWHREPSLRHVEEPTTGKRQVKMWPALVSDEQGGFRWITQEVFTKEQLPTINGFIRLITEYPPVIVELEE